MAKFALQLKPCWDCSIVLSPSHQDDSAVASGVSDCPNIKVRILYKETFTNCSYKGSEG